MNPLETVLQQQKGLTNKGYSIEQIQCAAVMLSSQYLNIISDSLIAMTPERKDGAD
jgi:hypothetical protein